MLGVVGYGDIGQACARLAKAFRMKVIALRRNTTLSAAEQAEGIVVRTWRWMRGGAAGPADYVASRFPLSCQLNERTHSDALCCH